MPVVPDSNLTPLPPLNIDEEADAEGEGKLFRSS
jgi:hypothetical protein